MDVEPPTAEEGSASQSRLYVKSPHPAYVFSISELVVVVSSDKDPFWIAKVTEVSDDVLNFQFYHHNSPKNGEKMVWKLHHTHGSCGITDVYVKFTAALLFTQAMQIRERAWKTICQACLKWNDIIVPETFK